MKQQYEEQFLNAFEPQKSNKPFACLIIPIAIFSLFLAIVLGQSSCVTPKIACKTLDAHPVESAKYCAEKWPVKEKATIKTVYKPGKRVQVPGETVYVEVNCDSIVKAQSNSHQISKSTVVKVPVYLQVDTSAIESNTIRENVAALAAKDNKYDSLSKSLTRKNDSLNALVIKKGEKLETTEATFKSCRSKLYWTWGIMVALLLGLVGYKIIKSPLLKVLLP